MASPQLPSLAELPLVKCPLVVRRIVPRETVWIPGWTELAQGGMTWGCTGGKRQQSDPGPWRSAQRDPLGSAGSDWGCQRHRPPPSVPSITFSILSFRNGLPKYSPDCAILQLPVAPFSG